MKKKLILTIVLLFVGVFSFSVNAATGSSSYIGDNYYVYVYFDSPLGGSDTGYLSDVRVRLVNKSLNDWVISGNPISISFNSTGTNYSIVDQIDCSPYVSSTGLVTVYLDTGKSGFVLAPGEEYQCSFTLRLIANSVPALSIISISGSSSSSYSFDDLVTLPSTELAYLSQLDSRLADIIDLITYTGSVPFYVSDPIRNIFVNDNNTVIQNLRTYYLFTVGKSTLNTYDSEFIPGSDTYVELGTVRYYFQLLIGQINSTSQPISIYYVSRLNNLFDFGGYLPHIDYFYSEVYSNASFQSNNPYTLELFTKKQYGNSSTRGVIPFGNNMTLVNGYVDVPLGVQLSVPSIIDTSGFYPNSPVIGSGYYPRDEYSILKDIYNAFANSDRSDQDRLSSDITSTSNSIHTQEEQYFSSNAQAIQAAGLSNYRFDQNQTGGISAVSNDFTAVFNALGGFNSVFIFSLTLSLALQIFRHHPIVFRAKQVNNAPKVGKGDP